MEPHGRIVGETRKKQCPIGMGSCVKANCEWWCNARCAVPLVANAYATHMRVLKGDHE